MIYHIHIAKNAGRSFLGVLRYAAPGPVAALQAYVGWDVFQQAPDFYRSASAVSGHMPWGGHAVLQQKIGYEGNDPETAFYVAFLRRPIERVASLYAYIMRQGWRHAAYPIIKDMSPQQFAEYGPFDNCQTRQLSGRLRWDWHHHKAALHEGDFYAAKHNAVMAYLGDVRHFHVHVQEIADMLGWDMGGRQIPYMNVSEDKPEIVPTAEFKRKWGWDLALWSWYHDNRDIWHRQAQRAIEKRKAHGEDT